MTKKTSAPHDSTAFPVLPLRDIVVFPHMIVPLFVGREKSIRALEEVMGTDKQIMLATQINASDDDPETDAIYRIGTVANVLQLLKLPDGTVKVLVEGRARAEIDGYTDREEFYEAMAHVLAEPEEDPVEIEALSRSVVSEFENYVKLNKKISPEVVGAASQIEDYSKLADTVASHLSIKIVEKQEMLETTSVKLRLEKALGFMEGEISVLQVEKRIRGRVKRQMEKSQREYYLNEQVKAIQKELGDGEEGADMEELDKKIQAARMPKEARKKADSELKKLKLMSPMSAEATVVRNYIETLVNLPWSKKTKIKHDLANAEDVLNEDHYGLDKVKERILEYLAVQQRVDKVKAPILCLVGPPGVGKTSLGQSVARATGRKFVRMALGGVRDEAEIRGHRRTYIGSMPGKVLQSLTKVGTRNPLFLLDEIDKLGMDFRGDPSSALLEVLDPEQNHTFADHYIEVDFDLSDVMFVATSNSLNIPPALLDRMEVIRLSGYTEDEKVNIAQRYLLPKAIRDHALQPKEFSVTDGALMAVIQQYTREAGVRNFERELMKLARKAVTEIIKGKSKKVEVTADNIHDFLGVPRFRHGEAEREDQVGVVTGLAWTEVGGDLLTIEATAMPGKGNIIRTGSLGDVMKESVEAARTVVRSRARLLGIKDELFEKRDIHIHVPDGATPKDGPSAGAAMTTAFVSTLTGIPVRADVAMTGEITLRGEVTAIGGLKEKLLAAHRGGIKTVLIPEENVKDLQDIPENVKNQLEIVPVSRMGEVIAHALLRKPEPIEWDGTAEAAKVPPVESTDDATGAIAH
ncbi:UNVERIFIED_ORG: endopeptidase La [Roseateles sp. XES5]|nr:endopeptidase La [Roseateles sp. XES5]